MNEMFIYKKCKKEYIKAIETVTLPTKYYPYNEENKKNMITSVKSKRTPYCMKYDVIHDGDNELLILKRKEPDSPILEVLHATECFDVLVELHLLKNHASREDMVEILKRTYYIPLTVITIFIKACNVCQERDKKRDSRIGDNKQMLGSITANPTLKALCTILQVMSEPDHGFSHVIIYLDSLTDYILMRPIFTKDGDKVAYELLKIFLDFGLPLYLVVSPEELIYYKCMMSVLQTTKVFSNLPIIMKRDQFCKLDWATRTTVMLMKSWLRTSKRSDWAIGLKEIQWHMNTTSDCKLHARIPSNKINSPYHSYFGFLPNHNLTHISRTLPRPIPFNLMNQEVKTIQTTSDCVICGIKVYDFYYKICARCCRICHFNCCVMKMIKSKSNDRILHAICELCSIEKDKEEGNSNYNIES